MPLLQHKWICSEAAAAAAASGLNVTSCFLLLLLLGQRAEVAPWFHHTKKGK